MSPLTEQFSPGNIDFNTSRVPSIVHSDDSVVDNVDSEKNYETAASPFSDFAASWNADEYVSGVLTKLKKKYNIKPSPSPTFKTFDSHEAFKEDVAGNVKMKKDKTSKKSEKKRERPLQMLKYIKQKLKKY